MLSTRSKVEASLTNFTDDPEKIGKNGNRRRSKRMTDVGNVVPQHQETEEENQPQEEEAWDREVITPSEEMYLPDLNNTPLSQALKDGSTWDMEDEVMVECAKLKQYFGVDTLLVQALSGRVYLYTNEEVESFPIQCSKTKFSPSLLDKALKGAEKERATPKDLPGEDWPHKIKKVLTRMDLDKRLDAYVELCSRYARNSVTLKHCLMINRGTPDDYRNVAKYELRGRKISNRMDEILAVIIQATPSGNKQCFKHTPDHPSTP